MDEKTQAVAEAIKKTLEHAYAGNCGILNLEEVAIAAIKASGAEHMGELVRAANKVIKRWDSPQWTWDIHTGVYIHELRDAIAKLPPELRGENE